jgi:hypothetical protein
VKEVGNPDRREARGAGLGRNVCLVHVEHDEVWRGDVLPPSFPITAPSDVELGCVLAPGDQRGSAEHAAEVVGVLKLD